MTSAKDLESLVRHAEAYPCERPAGSCLYDEGAVRPVGRLRLAGRVPVIAAGSNAAPARLAVKFWDRPATIPRDASAAARPCLCLRRPFPPRPNHVLTLKTRKLALGRLTWNDERAVPTCREAD